MTTQHESNCSYPFCSYHPHDCPTQPAPPDVSWIEFDQHRSAAFLTLGLVAVFTVLLVLTILAGMWISCPQ